MSSNHYNENYFKWQGTIGAFGGWANLHKFTSYIKPEYNIIDFGCGGGFLLNNIECKDKIGIEINPVARQNATELGIKTVASISEVEDEWADLIISNHALEHAHNPLQELKSLYSKLKKGGTIVFVLPCETIHSAYYPDDINMHIFSWGPMSLGNLFTVAGFNVYQSIPYIHKWPPKYEYIARKFGRRGFNVICRLYARYKRDGYQVKVIAKKEENS